MLKLAVRHLNGRNYYFELVDVVRSEKVLQICIKVNFVILRNCKYVEKSMKLPKVCFCLFSDHKSSTICDRTRERENSCTTICEGGKTPVRRNWKTKSFMC